MPMAVRTLLPSFSRKLAGVSSAKTAGRAARRTATSAGENRSGRTRMPSRLNCSSWAAVRRMAASWRNRGPRSRRGTAGAHLCSGGVDRNKSAAPALVGEAARHGTGRTATLLEGAFIMIKSTTALFAVLVVFAAGSAIAQDSKPGVTGTVQSIDPVTRMVVLEDGRTYHMRQDADVSMVTKGASIALACDTNGAN